MPTYHEHYQQEATRVRPQNVRELAADAQELGLLLELLLLEHLLELLLLVRGLFVADDVLEDVVRPVLSDKQTPNVSKRTGTNGEGVGS